MGKHWGRITKHVAAALLLLPAVGCDLPWQSPADTEVTEVLSESEQSVRNAQRGLDYFLLSLRRKDGQQYFLKAVFNDERGRPKAYWLRDVKRIDNQTLKGTIGSLTRIDAEPRQGEVVTVKRRQVLDWVVVRDGVRFGGFTGKPYKSYVVVDNQP